MDSFPTAPPCAPVLLDRLPVLLLDVQTTGASPARGHLLEVAWAATSAAALEAGESLAVTSHLVALPAGATLPPRIAQLTGIRAEDLLDAPAPAEVWRALAGAAAALGAGRAVAHVARFEQSFLEALRHECVPGELFPLRFLCTHEIALRLVPELPRRGLRALAGRFGHPLTASRRAEEHVRATACVWAELVERLRADAGVVDEAGLQHYLAEVEPQRRVGRSFAMPRALRLDLPERPGVYRMLGRPGNVLYVGKATSLRRRVNGYFQKRRHTRAPMLEMLTQVFDVDVTRTATALEAALLEADEIKRHQPPYNVQLRAREADLVFLDPSSLAHADVPTPRCPTGPVDRASVAGASAVLRLAAGGASACIETWQAALGLAAEAEPDRRMLAAGWDRFCLEHALSFGGAWTPGALLGLGHRLWRAELAASAEAAASEPEDAGGSKEEPASPSGSGGPWVPADAEAVQRALERTILRAAHTVRRARLLGRLSECSLTWRPPERSAEDGARRVVLDGGRVSHAEDVAFEPGPPPPGWPRGRLRRARAFDLATLDRMRVFLAEARRLVVAECDVVCRLGPRQILTRPALRARLTWV